MSSVRDIFFIVICALGLTLGACGIKPKNLSAPEGVEENAFPQTYPDPATNPAPTKR